MVTVFGHGGCLIPGRDIWGSLNSIEILIDGGVELLQQRSEICTLALG